MTIHEKLLNIQVELKAPKSQRNDFGKYNFRNCEDILEALKPHLEKYGALVLLSDEIAQFNGGEEEVTLSTEDRKNNRVNKTVIKSNVRFYIKATAKIVCKESGDSEEVSAYAREAMNKKGMDDAQVTGAASSYARKYALNGLFAIDDTKDADNDDNRSQIDSGPSEGITEKQEKMIYAVANTIGRDRDAMNQYTQTAYGKGVGDLTKDEASAVITFLKKKQEETAEPASTSMSVEEIDAAMNPSKK